MTQLPSRTGHDNAAETDGGVIDLARRRRSRVMLVALALLFIGPLLGSLVYHAGGGNWRPPPVSHGTLIDSPPLLTRFTVQTPDLQGQPVRLDGRWTLLFPGATQCDESCAEILYQLRQVRTALGKDTARLQRLYLLESAVTPDGIDPGVHPDLGVAVSAPMFAALQEMSDQPFLFYLVDPGGRPVTGYTAEFEQRGLLEDIKHLLAFANP